MEYPMNETSGMEYPEKSHSGMEYPDNITPINIEIKLPTNIQVDLTTSTINPSSAEFKTSASSENHQVPATGMCSRRVDVPFLVDKDSTEALAKTEEEDDKVANLSP